MFRRHRSHERCQHTCPVKQDLRVLIWQLTGVVRERSSLGVWIAREMHVKQQDIAISGRNAGKIAHRLCGITIRRLTVRYVNYDGRKRIRMLADKFWIADFACESA